MSDDRIDPTELQFTVHDGYGKLLEFDCGVEELRVLLSRAGLAIVPAADVLSAEERAVLEACDALSTASLEDFGKLLSTPWVKFAHVELARRAAKGTK